MDALKPAPLQMLQTDQLFIDTSVFRSNGFAVNNKTFAKLKTLCRSGAVKLITTDITEREIEKHVREHAKAAHEGFVKFRDKASACGLLKLRYINKPLKDFSQADLEEELLTLMKQYLQDCRAERVPILPDSVGRIFDDYFNNKPPFAGSGKKKSEFPDAFVMGALLHFCASAKKKIYIATGDADFHVVAATEPSLLPLDGVAAFLDIFNSHEELATDVHNLAAKHIGIVQDELTERIEQASFRTPSNNGAVEEVLVEKITVGALSLIDLSETMATFQLKGKATVRLKVFFENIYDYYQRLYGGHTDWSEIRRIKETFAYKSVMTFEFRRGDKDYFKIASLSLDNEVFYFDDRSSDPRNLLSD